MAQRLGFGKKAVSKKIIASVITLAVIALLVFAGPASAINLGLSEFSSSNPEKGEVISTTATITINSNERMSMPNPAGVFIDGDLMCAFALNSDQTCADSGITVTLISTSDANGYGYNADYGYGYGYNYGYNYGYSNEYGYGYTGYGYGYQQGYSNSKFTYNITIDTSKYSIGERTVQLKVDVGDSKVYSSGEQVITIGVSEGQQYADSPTETIGENVTEIVFDSGSSAVSEIIIPSSISSNQSVVLNLEALLSGDNVTLTNEITFVRETSTVNYTVVIPAGTVITGPSGWDGKITLPTVAELSSYGAPSGSLDVVINLGSVGTLTFSDAVKVVLGGMAGKRAGWTSSTGTLTSIDTVCDATHSNINAVSPKECYANAGSDLEIWTYHFTTFGAYTPAPSSGGGHGSSSESSTTVVPDASTSVIPTGAVNNDNNGSNGEQTGTNVGNQGRAGIMGAVIGALGPVAWTGIIVFLGVIAVAYAVVVRRKNKIKAKK